MDFDEGCNHIMAMKSLDGEVVPLRNKVQIVPEVEVRFEEKNAVVSCYCDRYSARKDAEILNFES